MIALLALAATAVLLVGASAATARPPGGRVPGRDEYFDRWSALHGGYDPRGSRWAGGWLGLAHACARPPARAGLAPNVLTLWGAALAGLVVALADLGGRWSLLAALVVVASGLADNIDGAVALLTDRASALGYLLDSLVDRLSDGLYLLGLYVLGAPGGLCVAAGTLVVLQEYARARAGTAGMGEIGVVTVAERPTRVIVTAITLLAAGIAPAYGAGVATAGAAAATGLGIVGVTQLLRVLVRALAR